MILMPVNIVSNQGFGTYKNEVKHLKSEPMTKFKTYSERENRRFVSGDVIHATFAKSCIMLWKFN
jgi:hypothetical protein